MNNSTFPKANMKRLISIDFLRGIVILLMTLDHVRDMFSSVAIGDHLGTDLPISYYLTRWVTHFCAPTFVFLAGLSIVLREHRHPQSKTSLQLFIIKRGLFLALISSTVVSFFWTTILRNAVFTIYCAELWAIGAGMIFVALMLYFRPSVIFVVSAALVLFHNLLNSFDNSQSLLWSMLHVKKELELITGYINIIFFYPLLPWCGIAGLGYSFGYYLFSDQPSKQEKWFAKPQDEKSKRFFSLAVAGIAFIAFCVLRYSNFYGDPNPFISTSGSISKTLLSFFDVTKYPPSLLYTLIMLAFVITVLAFDNSRFFNKPNKLVKIISQYGNCALPYYIVHLFVITLYAYLLAALFNHGQLISSNHLSLSFAITLLVILSLYLFVLWFKKFRNTYKHKYPILSYF